jgi:hypothetical protein
MALILIVLTLEYSNFLQRGESMAALAPFRPLLGYLDQSEPYYDVVIDGEHVQLRHYHVYHVARVRVESDEDDQNRETAYMRLLNYVLGRNSRKETIAPMAPLIQEDVAARMTALMRLETHEVDDHLTAFEVSIILPNHLTAESAPLPLDPEIQIQRVKPHLTATVRFAGFCGKRKQTRLSKYLRLWLHDKGYMTASAPRLAKYNPPFTLPFMRRNELHIDVVKR